MGSSSKQTVGYWYRLALHFGLCRAPVDALLEMRVGDRTAWSGLVEENTTLTIDQPELFGGTKSEGGLQGDMDVLMGAEDQGVNAYLAGLFGAEQSAYRGRVSVVWKGGRWGAMNPYPKASAFKLRRVSSSWYPEKSAVPMTGGETAEVLPWVAAHDPRDDGNTHEYRPGTSAVGPWYPTVEAAFAAAGWDIAGADSLLGWSPDKLELSRAFPANTPGDAAALFLHFNRYGATQYFGGMDAVGGSLVCANMFAEGIEVGGPRFWWNGLDLMGNESPTSPFAAQDQGVYRLKAFVTALDPGEVALNNCTNYSAAGGYFPTAVYSVDRIIEVRRTGRAFDLVAMNPAHILYDSIVDADMLAEPAGAVDEASFEAAADRLFDEGFGLCTVYDSTAETIEEFQQRLCNVAGAALTRDRRTGLWTLDLIRGAGEPGALPVLGDDDILDFAREPGALDDAVNQVAVKWLDPVRKEERTAGPVQALGHIQAFGGVVSETVDYPEIPEESLALRVAARDLRNRATPLARLDLRTTRVAWAWRTGTYFRLQAPKRGIADMVCMVSEIDIGTLRQGAIALVAVQDVFSMPATTYVVPQPPPPEAGTTPATAPEHQRLVEAPYLSLASALAPAELAALTVYAGFVATVASRPTSGWTYTLMTAAAGETLEARGAGDWTPVCLASEDVDLLGTEVAIAGASDMAGLTLPVAALWDEEIVRIDAVDLGAGTVTLGRGCADTVPAAHLAGSVLFLIGVAAGTDNREYADGEEISAKCISRASGSLLALDDAPTLTCVMDGRQARPYPPARLRINGEAAPEFVSGTLAITWAHRDRVLQGDQLVDTEMSDLGPEAGTTYSGYVYDDGDDTLLAQQLGIAGTAWSPAISGSRRLRVELEAVRAGLPSWQRQVRVFDLVGPMLMLESGDGLVLTESGDRVLIDPEIEPVELPHQATISLGGVFNAEDHIEIRLALSLPGVGNSRYVLVPATGLASMAEYAAALAAELADTMALAPHWPFTVEVDGTDVVLRTVWEIDEVDISARWVKANMVLRQAPLPVTAGSDQQSWVDLYVGGTTAELAAPYWSGGSSGPQYDETGSASMKLWITGTTWAAKKLIGGAPGSSWGIDVIDVAWAVTTPQTHYLESLVGHLPTLPAAINALAEAVTYGMAATVGTLPAPMTREAVEVSVSGEFSLLPDHPTLNGDSGDYVHPSLAQPFLRRQADGLAAWPAGAKQLSTLALSFAVGVGPAAGQRFVVILDDVPYEYVCTGTETGLEDICDGLAGVIEPGGLFTVDWYAGLQLIEIERTTANTAFTISARASYGCVATATIDS